MSNYSLFSALFLCLEAVEAENASSGEEGVRGEGGETDEGGGMCHQVKKVCF